jgi:hypothetical protein
MSRILDFLSTRFSQKDIYQYPELLRKEQYPRYLSPYPSLLLDESTRLRPVNWRVV